MNEELDEIIEALNECDFRDASENTFYENIIRPFGEKYKKSYSYDNGASKLVLLFPDLDFVIKIPFLGTYEPHEEYDEEADEYYEVDGGELFYFTGADCDENWNYCQAEVETFNFANEEQLGDCFAKTEYICSINNYPIYKQERATMFDYSESSSRHTQEDTNKIKDLGTPCNCNSDWASDVLHYFGEIIYKKLMSFLDANINDLHCGNIGYIGAKPVLVDYSGWNE